MILIDLCNGNDKKLTKLKHLHPNKNLVKQLIHLSYLS